MSKVITNKKKGKFNIPLPFGKRVFRNTPPSEYTLNPIYERKVRMRFEVSVGVSHRSLTASLTWNAIATQEAVDAHDMGVGTVPRWYRMRISACEVWGPLGGRVYVEYAGAGSVILPPNPQVVDSTSSLTSRPQVQVVLDDDVAFLNWAHCLDNKSPFEVDVTTSSEPVLDHTAIVEFRCQFW